MRSDAPLVGRAEEYARVCALLQADRPQVAQLTGPDGGGKTILAAAVAQRAATLGWKCVPNRVNLVLTPESTPRDLCRSISEELSLPTLSDRTARDTVALEACAGALLSAASERPILLRIMHFRPSNTFKRKFLKHFIHDIRSMRLKVPLLVILVDRSDPPLDSPLVDLRIDVTPPTEIELLKYLHKVQRLVDPPLSAREVAAYAAALSARPELINSGLRLFKRVSLPAAPGPPPEGKP